MSRVKELNLCCGYVLPKRFGSHWNEERIVLAPDRKQGRFRFAKIFLEFRIELHVRRVVQKQIELNLFVPGPFEQSRIQCVGLWRNALWICYTVGVLPPRPARCQNGLAEDVPVLCRGRGPILSDRSPSLTKAFFVCVAILRNNGGNSVRVHHRQTEAGWRSIIEHVDCVTVDLDCLRKGIDRAS